jgi:hypothetical protein
MSLLLHDSEVHTVPVYPFVAFCDDCLDAQKEGSLKNTRYLLRKFSSQHRTAFLTIQPVIVSQLQPFVIMASPYFIILGPHILCPYSVTLHPIVIFSVTPIRERILLH